VPFRLILETFLDGILMGPRKGSEDEFPCIWVAWMNGKVIALSYDVDDALNIAEFDVWVDTLRVIV
jgi:hypothetical protein